MKFALIMTGDKAPTPAPRIDAILSTTGQGLYSERDGQIWEASTKEIREALPKRYAKLYASGPWHDQAAKVNEAGRLVKGSPPYVTLRNARHAYVATVYLFPCYDGEIAQ